jgi:hypothetical protein
VAIRKNWPSIFVTVLVNLIMAGCCGVAPDARAEDQADQPLDAFCKDPRSPICTMEYKPVCAWKDTGVRCVTTPCPSGEWIDYPNACTACSHSEVIGYVTGMCKPEIQGK